ncbi:AAA family ATPase [Herbidospora sp. RD11066]
MADHKARADTRAEITRPTLTVVSGPPGSGKTTLARRLAEARGCPAIIRDEIKQGMVLASPGGDDDPLNRATLKAFFDVMEALARARVTVVAEAAYQDRLWRPNLEPLLGLARVRVVRCTVDAELARERILRRAQEVPHRAAHADRALLSAVAAGDHSLDAFVPISLDVPVLTVDTTDGYDPGFEEVVAFARG